RVICSYFKESISIALYDQRIELKGTKKQEVFLRTDASHGNGISEAHEQGSDLNIETKKSSSGVSELTPQSE
ncbi:hypothetical protein WA026_008086, partial [Henosepilachna vigintioctopunctata]